MYMGKQSEEYVKLKKDYIRLPKYSDDGYKERMLTECQSKLFLRAVIRNMDGESEYCYDSANGQTLREYAEGRDLNGNDIYDLLQRIAGMLQEAEKHLLSQEDVILTPDCIFLDGEGRNAKFCYYPEKYNNIERADFIDLAEYILEVTDHSDEIATELSYGYYNQVCGGDVNPSELIAKYYVESKMSEEADSTLVMEDNTLAEEESESFYFRNSEKEEEKLEVGNSVKILVSCFGIIVGLGGLYIFCFLNENILAMIGISRQNYIAGGAAMSGIIAITLALLIGNYMKKIQKPQTL